MLSLTPLVRLRVCGDPDTAEVTGAGTLEDSLNELTD